MTEAGPGVCEVCGEGPLQVVLHPVAVHYKGSGFYSTDYGRKGKKPAKEGSSESSSSSGDSSSSGGSSESSGSSTSSSSSGDAKKSSDS
jgi:predicted nucleic acid-binding Zn ribbon protein